MKNIFITGGAGFIGSHLTQLSLQRGNRVTVYDDLSVGRRQFLPANGGRFTFVRGDILDTSRLVAVVKKTNPDIVIHLAAIHHIPTCEKYPEKTIRVNIEGTQSILQASKEIKRFVFASTGALYQDQDKLRESTPVQPRDIYGLTKLSGEQLLELHSRRHQTTVMIARLFNTVGSHETNQHIIPDIITQLRRGKRTLQLGNINRFRDYVHIDDAVRAFYFLATAQTKKKSNLYNIGTGQEHSVRDIVSLCEKYLGTTLRIKQTETRKRKDDRMHQCADIKKISTQLGWQPKKSLDDAIHDVLLESKLT